jgi:methionyl aminopeptidase
LRPVYPLSSRRRVPDLIKKPDYAESSRPESEIAIRGSNKIEVLNAQEIEQMRTVCRITREVLDEAAKVVKVGTTTDEIDRVVHDACLGTH